MSEESRNDGTIRLLFEMSRDDNPPLYDDLIRFGKGVKRVNRLRLLAHEGLRAVTLPAPAPAQRRRKQLPPRASGPVP